MNPSIRRRVLFGVFIIIILAWVIGSYKGYYDVNREMGKLLDAQLAQTARAMLELSTHELYEQLAYEASSKSPTREIMTQIHPYEQHVVFQIWTHDGRLAVRSPSAPETRLVDIENNFQDREIDGERWRVYAIKDENSVIEVQVGEHYKQRDALSAEVASRLLTPLLVSLPLIVIMIWFSIGRAMKPLHKVAEEISSREAENLQPVTTKGVPLEAMPLVGALNSLLERVHIAYDNIRQFTSNAAHELRTPLAALKIHSQVALRTKDEKECREAVERVLHGVDRATSLVEQLLTLARLEPEAAIEEKEDVHLHGVAEEIIAELAPQAIKKNIEISLDDMDCCVVLGNPSMMGLLIRNLVENAIRYTPPNGNVDVTLVRVGNTVRLRVADSGPGIPLEERDKVFTRFYRSTEHEGENVENGTGLGLAIVERVCELQQGRIELGESSRKGLQVDVFFPVDPDIVVRPKR